jgi:hypothetical protein
MIARIHENPGAKFECLLCPMHDEDLIRRTCQPARPQQVGLKFLSKLKLARGGSIVEVLLPAHQSAVVVSAPGELRKIFVGNRPIQEINVRRVCNRGLLKRQNFKPLAISGY